MKFKLKRLALMLVMILFVSNFGGAVNTVQAAQVPSLRYLSKVVYVGGSKFGNYTDWCWVPSQNTEGYKVSYEVTTGKSLVTVTNNGKVEVTGDGVGKSIITVTYRKTNEKDIKAYFTVKIRRNSTDVKLAQAIEERITQPLLMDEEITLKTAKSFVGKSYKKGDFGWDNYMGVVSDQIGYVSSDEDIIKVEGKKLKAVGVGVASLTVYSYEYGGNPDRKVVSKTYVIEVADGKTVESINQVSTTKLEVTMKVELEKVAKEDFTITNSVNKMTYSLKDVTLDEKKTQVNIETFVAMNDGAEYVLTYDEKEYKFTATDGSIVDIKLNRTTIPVNTEVELLADLVDINGIIVGTVGVSNSSMGKGFVSFSAETDSGYFSSGKLLLYSENDKAEITLTYRTGEFDSSSGNELGTIERKFTVVAVSSSQIAATKLKYSISKDNNTGPDWNKINSTASICAEDMMWLYVYREDVFGADLSVYGSYILESSNPDLLIVDDYNGGIEPAKGIKAHIMAVGTGSAYILVKDTSGKLIDIISINIRPKREVSTIILDTSKITMSDSVHIKDSKDIRITFKDQYNEELPNQEFIQYTIEKIKGTDDLSYSRSGRTIKFLAGIGTENKTYTYKISAGKASKTIDVEIKHVNEASQNITFKVVSNGTSFESAFNNKDVDNWNNIADMRIGIFKDGILWKYDTEFVVNSIKKDGIFLPPVSYINEVTDEITEEVPIEPEVPEEPEVSEELGESEELEESEETDESEEPETQTIVISPATYKSVQVNVRTVTSFSVTKAPAGFYEIRLTVNKALYGGSGGYQEFVINFVVTDNQKPLVARQNSTYSSDSSFDGMIKNTFDFYYNESKVDPEDVIVHKVYSLNKGDKTSGNYEGQVFVQKVDVSYIVDGKSVRFNDTFIGRTVRVD